MTNTSKITGDSELSNLMHSISEMLGSNDVEEIGVATDMIDEELSLPKVANRIRKMVRDVEASYRMAQDVGFTRRSWSGLLGKPKYLNQYWSLVFRSMKPDKDPYSLHPDQEFSDAIGEFNEFVIKNFHGKKEDSVHG